MGCGCCLLSFHCSLKDHLTIDIYVFVCCLLFEIRIDSPGCPRTNLVDRAGLELTDLPASESSMLGLKECTTPACGLLVTNLFRVCFL